MPPQKTVYILVGVFEAGSLDREHLEIDYDIANPLPPQCSLVLTDVVNQDLGDQIAESVSQRVGVAVEYKPISELDGEALSGRMISLNREKIAVMLIDPCNKADIQSIPGHDPRSSLILSQLKGDAAFIAYELVKLIGLSHTKMSEMTIIQAVQGMSKLDSESVAYLVKDRSRQECFRHVFRAHPRPIDVAVSDCYSTYSPSASSVGLPSNDYTSSNTSSQGSRKRQRSDLVDSTQASRPRSRSQGNIKCDWTGCKHPSPYTTKRGLTEHLTLKHNISKHDAEIRAKAAFNVSFQPPRHLVVPMPSFGPTQTTIRPAGGQTVQKDQLYGLASWASSSPTIDSPASVLSMSPMLDGGLDEFPNPGSYVSTNNARVDCSPSPGLETRTRDLLLDNLDSNHPSDGLGFTFDEADPWNQHNLYHTEN